MYAEQHESDEERQFRQVFKQLAGEVGFPATFAPAARPSTSHSLRPSCVIVYNFVTQDMEVSPSELMNILNRIIGKRKMRLFKLASQVGTRLLAGH